MLADIFGSDRLIVAIVLVVLLFGGAAIPKLARNLGSAKNEFEKGMEEGKTTDSTTTTTTSPVADTPHPRPRRRLRQPDAQTGVDPGSRTSTELSSSSLEPFGASRSCPRTASMPLTSSP